MDPTTIFDLIAQRRIVPIMAIVIYFAVRLVKNDTKIPISIPGTLRFWLALVLGAAGGAVQKALETNPDVTWKRALGEGVLAAVLAIMFHDGVVGSLRAGKELPLPGLVEPGIPPEKGKPPTIPPGAAGILLVVGALSFLGVTACGYGGTACKVIDVAHENCAWLRYLDADGTVKEVAISPDDAREFGRALAAKQAAKPDGGAR